MFTKDMLTVKTLSGRAFKIRVQPSDTILAVKKNIEDSQGKDNYPYGQQLLINGGKVLKDETTLVENKVTEKDFLVVMLSKSKTAGSSPAAPTSGVPISSPLDLLPQETVPATGTGDLGKLEFLRNNDQFQKLRTMVHSNPQSLEAMLQELVKQNPQLLRLINENQAEFLQLVNEPIVGSDGDADIFDQPVNVSPAEQEAIQQLQVQVSSSSGSDSGSSSSSSSSGSDSGSSSSSSSSGSISYMDICFIIKHIISEYFNRGRREPPSAQDAETTVLDNPPSHLLYRFCTAWNNGNDTAGFVPTIEAYSVFNALEGASLRAGRLLTTLYGDPTPKALPTSAVQDLFFYWTLGGYLAGSFVKEQLHLEKHLVDITDFLDLLTRDEF